MANEVMTAGQTATVGTGANSLSVKTSVNPLIAVAVATASFIAAYTVKRFVDKATVTKEVTK